MNHRAHFENILRNGPITNWPAEMEALAGPKTTVNLGSGAKKSANMWKMDLSDCSSQPQLVQRERWKRHD